MQAYPYDPERSHAMKQRLIEAGYQDGIHPYSIIKTDMDAVLSKLCQELMNLANKRHDLPYWKPDLLIQLKDREPLRQAMEDYVQEYLNEAVPWYASAEGVERAEYHAEMNRRQLASMHGMEKKKSKPKPAKKQSMDQVIAGLSPEDKAKLLQSLIK